MTWQKWGSKQALEKRKTSLSLMDVFNIAPIEHVWDCIGQKTTNAIQNIKILTN
jgi:hypothetical protein